MSECQCENCGVGYDAEFGTTVDDLEYCQECAIKILKAQNDDLRDILDKMEDHAGRVKVHLDILIDLLKEARGE
jgi:hypothetical protein